MMSPADKALSQRLQDINRLVLWHRTLQHHANAVQHSMSWRIGQWVINTLLRLLGRHPSPTVWQSIERLNTEFEHWQSDYWHQLSPREVELLNQADWHDAADYRQWLAQAAAPSPPQSIHTQPHFSLLWVVEPFSEATWQSIQAQAYPHWELCCCGIYPLVLVDNPRVKTVATSDSKASYAQRLNTLLAQASGDYILVLASHDKLAEDALLQLAAQIEPDTTLIYSDHDYLDAEQQRCAPYFKSDWNPDLFYNQNYIAPCVVYQRTLAAELGGFTGTIAALEYDLTLRFLEHIQPQHIKHVVQVLYHQTQQPKDETPKNLCADLTALQAHFARTQPGVTVDITTNNIPHVFYPLSHPDPLVSIIIPTRDRLDLLQPLVHELQYETTYPALEIVVMDNGSQEPATLDYLAHLQREDRVNVIREDSPFNYARLNNLAVEQAQGHVLVLLNNDVRIMHGSWLNEMVRHAQRAEVGAVGAKLLYPDDTIQHAGVVMGLGGVAGHIHQFLPRMAAGYYHKTQLVQNYSAVTAACMVLRREVYHEVGGMDATHLAVAFNDVDLCLRIQQHGYRIVWTPHAELYHLESISRGSDNNPQKYRRFQQELRYMQQHWHSHTMLDPFYNPNLSRQDTQCALVAH